MELIVDNTFMPELEMSRDKRHLDEFPGGASEMQAIIFNGFIEERNKRLRESDAK